MTELQEVRESQVVHNGYGTWTWNYRVGNRMVFGPVYPNEQAARLALHNALVQRATEGDGPEAA